MYTVINDIRRSFAVLSALFITVITSKVKGHEHCSPQELMNCAKPLSVLTDSGLTFVSSKADLDKICPDLKEAIRCIHAYTRHCMNNEHRRHFKKLFHGTGLMVHELCRNGTYQEEYLKHAPCMKRVEKQNEVCFKRYTKAMNEIQSNTPEVNSSEPDIVNVIKKKREAADEGIKNVCCSFQEYVECSTHTMRRQCGEEAAEFSRRFMDKMSSSMIQLHCTEYGRRECGLIAASSRIENSALAVIAFSLVALFLR
ncbi:uncharacterized protein LOC108912896 [Anoplophora glabripennis]|uniref:uncharacterized protein LOC108912896 n=1 Tax=Anoplophora glabripennis TaxID=217634 RepID=UPI000874AAAA|nr:uncharacterized protein LOC108912896 [Anoplophora glabripennis]